MNFIEADEVETTQADKANNSLWVEKYRPSTLAEYIGNDHLKVKVEQYISEGIIPHLLLYGTAGTGKTSLAKLITKSIKCDKLYINASSENRIDDVRIKVTNFASSMGFNTLKVVILDEADYLTPAAQAALRNLMETYSATTRFILTCNFVERVIAPIVSRSQPYEIIPPNKKDVAKMLIRILDTEKIKYDKDGIVAIVQAHHPDIRAVINTAQRATVKGVLTLDREAVVGSDLKSKILELLMLPDKKQAYKEIRQALADNSVRDYSSFYTLMYERVDDYANGHASQVILNLAEGQFKDVQVVDKEINFMATIINILQTIK